MSYEMPSFDINVGIKAYQVANVSIHKLKRELSKEFMTVVNLKTHYIAVTSDEVILAVIR
jgi:hypothetical protein